MTDITKRLAEASMEEIRAIVESWRETTLMTGGYKKAVITCAEQLEQVLYLYDLRSTAAQEANVQGGEWVMVPREPTQAMLNAARDWSVAKYSKGIGNDAALGCYTVMLSAAPHPTPAPASGEVTDAMIEAAREAHYAAYVDAHHPYCSKAAMRAALEAATRARQGEAMETKPALPGQGSEFDRWYDERGEGETTRDVARLAWNAGIHHARQVAPNAADAEAYRAVAWISTRAIAHLEKINGVGKVDAWNVPHEYDAVKVYIPTAAPVPADEGEKK